MSNKKNGGVIPPVSDKRVLLVPVGCGKCMECKKQKAKNWSVRLQEEIRENKKGKMITLTFSNESVKKLIKEKNLQLTGYNLDNEIAKIGIRRFLENWRKTHKKSIKHWLITELGQTNSERIHIHGILFTDNINDIKNKWKYGMVHIGEYVNEKTINYIVKYVNKTDEKHKYFESKIFCSSGIGNNYLKRIDSKNNKYKGDKTNELYITRSGAKLNLPIYYRNHIYTEKEKELLWLQKLDKEKRYVNGKEIDISDGEEEYYKVLEQERIKNKRLGYLDDKINWEKKKYENELRNVKKIEILKKNYGTKGNIKRK